MEDKRVNRAVDARSSEWTTDGTVRILGNPTLQFNRYPSIRIYYFQMFENDRNGTCLIDLVPKICKAGFSYIDGNTGIRMIANKDKPGLYDTISGKFFVNQISGNDFFGIN